MAAGVLECESHLWRTLALWIVAAICAIPVVQARILNNSAVEAVPTNGPGSGPQPTALPPAIVAPVDSPYPGTIRLTVDLTDVRRRIINVRELIPVRPGPLTLLYPRWIPGDHAPSGPISKLAGLVISGNNGRRLQWLRDRVDVYCFHLNVPSGVDFISLEFQYLPPLRQSEGRISFSSKIVDLAWNTVLLYPAGYFSRDVYVSPTLKLPMNWHFASALEVRSSNSSVVTFDSTSLEALVDSPVCAGVNFARIDLSPDPKNRVYLDIFSDSPKDALLTTQELNEYKNLLVEAAKVFGSIHYSHYDFLLLLSDTVGPIGLEHHQCSEDGARANYFSDWDRGIARRDLLAHEYSHSWNGKFRRPAGLWTPNFNVPMQDDLLWVYEGLTEYLGYVLTARAGLRTAEQTRDLIAQAAANLEASPGRSWRPLLDTTNQPTISQRSPESWASWQRSEDYYLEGMLIWLDVDTKIREMSNGAKSLDEFAKLFFGINSGSSVTQTYTFNDVVATLNRVQKFDWADFLHARVDEVAPNTPEDGIVRGGYSLKYGDRAPAWLDLAQVSGAAANFSTSLGFSVKANGNLESVWWNSPAFKAAITPDMHLANVNGEVFSISVLRSAVKEAEQSTKSIRLTFDTTGGVEQIDLDYHAGLRFPKLERTPGVCRYLDEILAPVHAVRLR